jgi:hypothetical protein
LLSSERFIFKFWIVPLCLVFYCSIKDNINTQYNELAYNLKIEETDERKKIKRVNIELTKLLEKQNIIFLFDDLMEYDDIANITANLPRKIQIIITTLNNQMKNRLKEDYVDYEIKPFSEDESMKYLKEQFKK